MIILGQAGSLPGGHIAGIPVEETLVSVGPVLLVAGGAALVTLRARLRRFHHARPDRGRNHSRDAVAGAREDSAMTTKR